MNITIETVRIVFFCLPGIVTLFLFNRLLGISKEKRSAYSDLLKIAVFSFLSHASCALIAGTSSPDSLFSGNSNQIQTKDVFYAIIAGIAWSFILSALYRYNILHKAASFMRVSNHYGDEDVWHHMHSLIDDQYITVRDYERKIVYKGYIVAHSDSDMRRELMLGNVDVFDAEKIESGTPMYTMKYIYLDGVDSKMVIEIPEYETTTKKSRWKVYRPIK